MSTINLAGIPFEVLRVDGDRDGKGLPDRILLERDDVCAEYLRSDLPKDYSEGHVCHVCDGTGIVD